MSVDADRMWEGGVYSIDLTPLSMLHPCTWSFPCWLVKQMSCLWASWVSLWAAVVSHGFVMRARKDREHWGRWCTRPHTVSVHMDGHNRPSPWEAKGFVVSEQVLEAASRRCRVTWIRESPHAPLPSSQRKKKSVAVLHFRTFLPPCFRPACIHLVFVHNQSSTAVWLHWYLAQSLDLLYHPAFTVSLFPFYSPLHA